MLEGGGGAGTGGIVRIKKRSFPIFTTVSDSFISLGFRVWDIE
jgi:hypothetical protein